MAKIGFIGMGNMGYAILKGIMKQMKSEEITFTCLHEDHKHKVQADTGVVPSKDNVDCVAGSKYVILAIKPQQFESVISEIKPKITPEHVIISMAPGYTIEKLSKMCGTVKIVRTMPNTPAMVGEGITGISYTSGTLTEAEVGMIDDIFKTCGSVVHVEESKADAVSVVGGCSPAFTYMFIDALATAGVKHGLKKADALIIAAQAVLGSAKMVMETGDHPDVLRDKVCSPGGTTIEGVESLESDGLRAAVMHAVDAAVEKGKKIG